ncbi:MAG: hypothetical protein PHP69_06850, partial [Candidatus Omnitrophica bacterium]|nr:hypothetical protein [Candidatus Omnitrophota bacterium]
QDNAVFSVDWKVKPMSFFTVKGEIARSLTQKDETSNDIKWSDDSAVNIDTEAVFGKVRLQNNYERVGTNFTSLSGVASADREERQHRIYYDYSKNFGVDAGWRTYHNNLSNTLSTGTVNNIYDINTFIKPIPDVLPDMKLDADYEIWKKCSDDDASTIDSTKHTYGFGLENTTSIYRYGAGISFENTVDDVALNNSRQKVIYDAFLRSNYQWGKFRLIPYLSYEYERDKTRSVKATDDYQTFRLGSSMYWGSNMSLTWSFARANIDYESDGNDQHRDFIDVNLRMNLFNNPDKSVKIVYRHNDYDKEDDSVSFIEDILTCMYSFNF